MTDEDVESMLDKLRRQHAHWHTVERAAANEGDRVKIDFDGFIDGKPFPGGSGKDFSLELGSRQMIPGFEEGIIRRSSQEITAVLKSLFLKIIPLAIWLGKKRFLKSKYMKCKKPIYLNWMKLFSVQVGIKEW